MTMSWPTTKLGDLADISRGASPRPISASKYFDGGTIPWIKIADATKSGKFLYETKQHVNEYGASFSRRLPPGTILVAASGTLGYTQILGVEGCAHDGWLILQNLRELDRDFAYYALKTLEQHFFNSGSGAAIQNINTDILRQTEIPYPPLPTQRRVAAVLSAYDDLIENCQKRIHILEEMARALYREWFVHFRFPGCERVRCVESSLDNIPEGWVSTTLGEFVTSGSVSLQTGPFGTQLKASHYSSEGTPVVNVRNIGFGTLKAEKLEYLPNERAKEHSRHELRAGDIVFGRKGAVERHFLVSPNEDGWIQGSDCIRLRVEAGPLTPRFLSMGCREERHQRWMMNQCSGGATMASLNQDILCRIPLVVPPSDLLTAFEQFCAPALNQVDVLSSQIQNLRRTRDLLLPRLLSGQMPVNNA